jgi:transcriptional/translational regulatory protein YebC/TACO1
VNAEVAYVPTTLIMLDLEQFKSISRLIEAFEELDDIQNVYTNFDIDEKLLDNTIK